MDRNELSLGLVIVIGMLAALGMICVTVAEISNRNADKSEKLKLAKIEACQEVEDVATCVMAVSGR